MDVQPSKDHDDHESVAGIEASSEDAVISSSESWSDSDDEGHRGSTRSRQSPSPKNAADRHGVPYLTQLPRHERRRIELETRKNKKPGN